MHLLLCQIYADRSVPVQSARSADSKISVGNAKGMYTSLTQVVKVIDLPIEKRGRLQNTDVI